MAVELELCGWAAEGARGARTSGWLLVGRYGGPQYNILLFWPVLLAINLDCIMMHGWMTTGPPSITPPLGGCWHLRRRACAALAYHTHTRTYTQHDARSLIYLSCLNIHPGVIITAIIVRPPLLCRVHLRAFLSGHAGTCWQAKRRVGNIITTHLLVFFL